MGRHVTSARTCLYLSNDIMKTQDTSWRSSHISNKSFPYPNGLYWYYDGAINVRTLIEAVAVLPLVPCISSLQSKIPSQLIEIYLIFLFREPTVGVVWNNSLDWFRCCGPKYTIQVRTNLANPDTPFQEAYTSSIFTPEKIRSIFTKLIQ